jgi:hypothetical protein
MTGKNSFNKLSNAGKRAIVDPIINIDFKIK